MSRVVRGRRARREGLFLELRSAVGPRNPRVPSKNPSSKLHPLAHKSPSAQPFTRGSGCSTPLQSYGSSSRHARPDWLNCARTVNAHTGRSCASTNSVRKRVRRLRAPSTSRCRRLSRVSFRTAQSIYERLSAGCAPRTHTTASLLPVSAFSHRDLRARTRCFRNSSWRRSQI